MSGRGLKIVLAVSLAVNLFTVGAIGGLVYVGSRRQAARSAAIGNPLVRAADALPPAEQETFRQMLRRHVVQDRPTIRDSRQARRRLMELLAAPAVDRAAVGAALAQARADDSAVRAHLEDGVADFVAGLSPTDRAAFVGGFRKAALARWVANHPAAKGPPPAQ